MISVHLQGKPIHLCCCKWPNFIIFNDSLFPCMCVCRGVCMCVYIYIRMYVCISSSFFIYSSFNCVGCFCTLAVVHNAAVNSGVHVSFSIGAFVSLSLLHQEELLSHRVVPSFGFLETSMLFPTVAAPICIPPPV